MRKYLILILTLCMLLSSCSEAKQAESIKKKSSVKTTVVIRGDGIPVKKPDFNKLTFKAQLSQEEKKYFQDKNKDFSERVKQYAIY